MMPIAWSTELEDGRAKPGGRRSEPDAGPRDAREIKPREAEALRPHNDFPPDAPPDPAPDRRDVPAPASVAGDGVHVAKRHQSLEEEDDNPYQKPDEALPDREQEDAISQNPRRERGRLAEE